MRSQGKESNIKKHILDIDFFAVERDTSKYVFETLDKVKEILASTESAILLRDLYDREFNLGDGDITDNLIGPVIYREQEDVTDFTNYGNLIDIYINYTINKIFGYTLDEFLCLTKYQRDIIIDKARTHLEETSRMMDEIKESTSNGEGIIPLDDYDDIGII